MLLNLTKALLIIVAIIAVVIFFVLPINLPYNIKVLGKVAPSRVWTLTISGGQVETHLINNKSGMNESYFTSQSERADALKFVLNKKMENNFYVSENDTVGSIFSNEVNRQIAELQGNLEEAKASLLSSLTGNKKSVVKAAEDKLEYEKKKAEEQEKILARLQALYDKKLISTEEYEIAKNQADLNQINISIAKAQLEQALSGAKSEDIAVIKSKIASLQNIVDVMKKRVQSFTFLSPINGVLSHFTRSDTVLTIADTSEYVIDIPVELGDKKYIHANEIVELKLPHENKIIKAKIWGMDSKVQILLGNQVVFIKAVADKETNNLLPGMFVRCSIECGKFTIGKHLERILNEMFN